MEQNTQSTEGMYVFFLGGRDLEMSEIAVMLRESGQMYHDRSPGWGQADLSIYEAELEGLPAGSIPVFIELKDSKKLAPPGSIFVDHHGEAAGHDRPTSIEQVAGLLEVAMDRRRSLIAANDRGWIPAMLEAGASLTEALKLRREDRQAQGISETEEKAEEAALGTRKIIRGRIFIRATTAHNAILTDSLYPESRDSTIVILCPNGELDVYGSGTDIERFESLYRRNPQHGSWKGGDLPLRGYFGANDFRDLLIDGQRDIEELLVSLPAQAAGADTTISTTDMPGGQNASRKT